MKNIFKNFPFIPDLHQVLIYIKYIVISLLASIGTLMIIEILIEKIRTCGTSRYRISQDTGIDEAALCRIMQGAGCNVETADILCKYFGLELGPKKKGRK
jgi:hypothetical protein